MPNAEQPRTASPLRSIDTFINVITRSFIRRYGLPPDDAEDMIQAVWLRLAEFPEVICMSDVLDDDGKLSLSISLRSGYNASYLKRMIVTAISRWRTRRVRTKLHDALEIAPLKDKDGNHHEDACLATTDLSAERFEEAHDLNVMLRCLKPAERLAVSLFAEYSSLDTVAGLMGQSRAWVDSRYRSAILKLRTRFRNRYQAVTSTA